MDAESMKKRCASSINFLLKLILILGLALSVGCATGPRLVNHAFSFDARWDSPDIEILGYRYGDYLMTRTPNYRAKDGGIRQSLGVSGPFPRGDSLYVKWKIKSSGAVHEDTVDLRERLPRDMTDHRVYFVVDGHQLRVFLISPEKVSGRCPADMALAARTMEPRDRVFRLYCDRQITTLYPDKPKF
jgi:hypothetical protein